jgi:hypothetical protein
MQMERLKEYGFDDGSYVIGSEGSRLQVRNGKLFVDGFEDLIKRMGRWWLELIELYVDGATFGIVVNKGGDDEERYPLLTDAGELANHWLFDAHFEIGIVRFGAEEIRERMIAFHQDLRDFEVRVAEIRKRMEALRKRCPHPSYRDTSSCAESSKTCNFCDPITWVDSEGRVRDVTEALLQVL